MFLAAVVGVCLVSSRSFVCIILDAQSAVSNEVNLIVRNDFEKKKERKKEERVKPTSIM